MAPPTTCGELHQQLVAVLAEHRVSLQPLPDGGVRLSVAEHAQVADQLLIAVDAHVAAACARAAAGALRDAAKDWAADPDDVGDTPADARNWLRKRAMALSTHTTEGDPT